MKRSVLLLTFVLACSSAGGCCATHGCSACGEFDPVVGCAPGNECGQPGCDKCNRCVWLSRCGKLFGCHECGPELGCGETWWGDWFENPPSRCDHCDQYGNWTGKPPYPARGHAPRYQTVARQGEPTLAERDEYADQQ
jgi:hypothetical protein